MSTELDEAMARADALAAEGHWGGDAQHIRVLADALRDSDSAKAKAERAAKKAEKAAKDAADKTSVATKKK